MFAGEKQFYNIYVNESDNGVVQVPYNIALENEEVQLKIIPDSNYKLDLLNYSNNFTKEEVIILDNKFVMPTSDITINATFQSANILENPTTGDNINLYFSIVGISLIGFILTIIYIRKNIKL